MEMARGEQYDVYATALSLSLPPCTLAGWPPTCEFATVNESLQNPATSIQLFS
jgi:hypothetical protein